MVEFDRSAFIGKFQEEAQDLLQRLNEGVITLEGDPDNRELIDQMMRDAHTIKGTSRMVGLIEISDVAHWLEDIMVRVRDKEMAYTPEMSDSFFEALDAIVYLTDNSGVNVDDAIDLDGLKKRLADIAATGAVDADAAVRAGTPRRAAVCREAEAEEARQEGAPRRRRPSREPEAAEPSRRPMRRRATTMPTDDADDEVDELEPTAPTSRSGRSARPG